MCQSLRFKLWKLKLVQTGWLIKKSRYLLKGYLILNKVIFGFKYEALLTPENLS